MVSVIFTVALSHLGRVAGAAVSLADHIPLNRRFEISQDGESLFAAASRYEFVGFSDDGYYVTPSGERAHPGRRLGRIVNDDGKVRQLNCTENNYVMIYGIGDCAEVYRLMA